MTLLHCCCCFFKCLLKSNSCVQTCTKIVSHVFQGVYFEKVLKSSDTSLWVRNIQMYLSGIVATLIGVFVKDGEKVLEKGFFFGYTPWVCFVVCKCTTKSPAVSCSRFFLFCSILTVLFFNKLQFWPVWAAYTRPSW